MIQHSSALGCSVLLVVLWFISSICFNIATPRLVKLTPTAEDVTMIELTVTVFVGILHLSFRGMKMAPATFKDWAPAAMLGGLHLSNCRAFIYSLQFIPISLAQTIRATNPCWVVIITSFFGEQFRLVTISTLIPLVGGFALAVGADPVGVNSLGLMAALCSVNGQVFVNLFSKNYIGKGTSSSAALHPFQIQFTSCLFGMLWLLPIWVMGGGPSRVMAHYVSASPEIQNALILYTVLDGVLYFTEQTASFSCLNLFKPLTFAVMDTVRRLTIVVISGFYMQGNPCTVLNGIGILFVMIGAIAYSIAKDLEASENLLVKPVKAECPKEQKVDNGKQARGSDVRKRPGVKTAVAASSNVMSIM